VLQRSSDADATSPVAQRRRPLAKKTVRVGLYTQLLVLDIAALTIGPVLARALLIELGFDGGDLWALGALALIYLISAFYRGAYSFQAIADPGDSLRKSMHALTIATMMVLFTAFFLKSGEQISRLNFAVGICLSALMIIIGRALFPRYAMASGRGSLLNELVIVHGEPVPVDLASAVLLDAKRVGLRPDLHDPQMLNLFGRIVESFDRVVIHSNPEDHRAWALLLKGAGIDGEILLEEADEVGAIGMRKFRGKDTLLVSRQPLSLPNRIQKRMLDLAVAIPMILVLCPLFILVAAAVKLESAGPVFFRQDRVGRGNRLFKVLKFRSMRVEQSDANGNRSASRDDDRITRVGRIIRATSIDELPQLLNVLLGDMSLVGPRPHALGSLAGDQLFWQVDETYWLRHQLKPGITGLAQVRGFRGATLEKSDLISRLQSDMEYVQNWDIWRDIGILIGTFRVIVHRNAY
jgi:polysaccharide biosynthesis protein PslA